jgi:hypothetical protein
MGKLGSRKLWLTVGAVLIAVGSVLHGDITWAQALWPIVSAVLGYVGAEGAADVARALVNPTPPGPPAG